MFANGEERLSREAIEEVDVSLLGDLGEGFDRLAAAMQGVKSGRSGQVAIPDVVMHLLEIREELAGLCVERKQRVGIEVVADAVAPVKIHHGGTGWDIDDAACRIKRHASPVVRRAGGLPGIRRPSFIAGFAGMRNGVEGPAESAGANIECANVTGRRRMRLRVAAANDDEVLVNDSRSGEDDGLFFVVATQLLAQIDAAVLSEARDRLAGLCIEAIEEIHNSGEDARGFTVGPVSDAARRLCCMDA